MTGLKSGSGDDLWDDDDGDENGSKRGTGNAGDTPGRGPPDSQGGSGASGSASGSNRSVETPGADESGDQPSPGDETSSPDSQPYIIRRAVQDKSVQFERDERLTFFVRSDVAEGERDLVTDLQSTLGRDVPKFDVREAVYRAALKNPDDVLDELLEMGYSLDED